jgi:riboflavin kinase/FMN adenylyltransferase
MGTRVVDSLEQASGAVGRRRTVCCVGVFDGVHLGHQRLIGSAVAEAKRRRALSVLLTFRNHPLEVLAPAYAPPLLTEADDKIARLLALGPSVIAAVEFNRRLAAVEPEQFIDDLLAEQLRARAIYCGADFRFGREGRGDLALLKHRGAEHGIRAKTVDAVYVRGRIVSSTWTRALLEEGQVELAAECLGRPHLVRGTVVRGEGRGRQLGYPTANLASPTRVIVPGEGIYAVRVDTENGTSDGVIHIGPVPTFGVSERRIEVHILDFEGDVLGQTLGVHFVARIRDVERFRTPDDLVAQIHRDARRARRLLKAQSS